MENDKNELLNHSPSYDSFMASPEPSYKHTTYFNTYDRLFNGYRGKPITFVEIGVLNGGSLFMWRNYFGPEARIIGIDLNPEAQKWQDDGFEIFIGSQQDPDFWDEFLQSVPEIDILLDDGGHTYLQQIVTAEMVMKHINDGGMLVVEDTHTSYMKGFGDARMNFMNYVLQTMHRINSRCGAFTPAQKDRRVLSVEVFESIVAFKIDRGQSLMESKPVWNQRPDAEAAARDYRHESEPLSPQQKQRVENMVRAAFSISGE